MRKNHLQNETRLQNRHKKTKASIAAREKYGIGHREEVGKHLYWCPKAREWTAVPCACWPDTPAKRKAEKQRADAMEDAETVRRQMDTLCRRVVCLCLEKGASGDNHWEFTDRVCDEFNLWVADPDGERFPTWLSRVVDGVMRDFREKDRVEPFDYDP